MRNYNDLLTARYGLMRINPRIKKVFFDACATATTARDITERARNIALIIPDEFYYRGITYHVTSTIRNYAMRYLLATGLQYRACKRADNLYDYMAAYAKYKVYAYYKLSDFGALADMIETLCHIAICGYRWRVNKTKAHVSEVGKIDFTFDGKKIEEGINGKTWQEATPTDFAAGKYQSVVYGMIAEDTLKAIAKLVIEQNITKAITITMRNLYYFSNKQDFFRFMVTCGKRSALIQYKPKPGIVQSIYNDSTAKAYNEKVSVSFPSFYTAIRAKYPDSDLME